MHELHTPAAISKKKLWYNVKYSKSCQSFFPVWPSRFFFSAVTFTPLLASFTDYPFNFYQHHGAVFTPQVNMPPLYAPEALEALYLFIYFPVLSVQLYV